MCHKLRLGFNAKYLWDWNLRGFNRYAFSLLKQLQRDRSLDIVLFTERRSPIHPSFARELSLKAVTISSPKALVWEQVMLPMALRRHQIQIFHAPADGGLPAWRACPYVLTYHHAPDKSLEYLIAKGQLPGPIGEYLSADVGVKARYLKYRHDLLRWIYLRRANRIIAVSQFGKWELVGLLGVPEEKVVVIYEAADASFDVDLSAATVEEARARHNVPQRYLLFVGGFDPRKNVEGLLHAVFEARKAGVQEAMVLVGSGGDTLGAKAAARSLGMQEGRDVLFLERVHEDLPALYCGATAFITLSWSESFCLPIVEAMRCGTPVIASNQGAIPEIMANGGISVDPRNRTEVVQAIRAVTGRRELQARLRESGLHRARAFSWENTAEQTIEVYREVLHNAASTTVRV